MAAGPKSIPTPTIPITITYFEHVSRSTAAAGTHCKRPRRLGEALDRDQEVQLKRRQGVSDRSTYDDWRDGHDLYSVPLPYE